MVYTIRYRKSALKALGKLERPIRIKITEAINALSVNPRPAGVKKLVGTNEWRIRVADYRIVYLIKDGELLVLIVTVGHRRDVYEGR